MKHSLPKLTTTYLAVLSCLSFSALAAENSTTAETNAQIKKIEQLQNQYEVQLKELEALKAQYKNTNPNEESASYQSLKELMDRVSLFGFFRAKYDHDDNDPTGSGTNNKHFYMDLEGKLKVSEIWDARFQIETRKGYTVNQSWREGDSGSSDQDGTLQRIWVEGRPANIGVTLGTKWWGYGFQAVPFGHAADGIQLDYDVVSDWNAKVFWLRPRQGDLVTMPNGQETQIAGLNVTGSLLDNLQTSLTYATNENHDDDQKMDNMGAFELQLQATSDILLRGAFVMTDADDYNTSQEYRIDYKQTDLEKAGSYSLYTRYIDFERYGDYSHDDEWGSLPGDAKGWIFGAKYVLARNIIWETFYSVQQRNRATEEHNRDLFRTQIDFHF